MAAEILVLTKRRRDTAAADEGLRDGMEVEDDELEAALEHGGAAAG